MIGEVVVPLGDATWTTAGWPAGIAVLGVLLAVGLVVASIVAPASGLGRPWLAANVAIVSVFTGVCASGAPALVRGEGTDGGVRTAQAFRGLLTFESLAGGAVVAFLGIAAAVWLGRARAGEVPWIRIGLAVPALSMALFSLGHVVWLRSIGMLPTLEVKLPAFVHVGPSFVLPVRVVGADPEAWDVRAAFVAPRAAGPVEVVVKARRFGISGTRTLTTIAGEDRFDPSVALAVGHEWVFERTTSWRSQYLWVIPSRGESRGALTSVRVTGRRFVTGLRLWDVAVVGEGATSTMSVYAWNGAAMVYPEVGEPTPFLALEEGPVGEDGTVGCTYAAFPSASCACYPRAPGGPLDLPGPVRCSWSTGGALSAGVSAFLAVVTLGLVLEDPDRSHVVELVASGSGRAEGWIEPAPRPDAPPVNP